MGVAGLAGGILSSVFSRESQQRSNSLAEREYREKQEQIAQKEGEDKALFNRQYYQDITKRTDIQNMLRVFDENQKKADSRDAARAAIMGTTPEQQLAAKEVSRRTYADALADMASNASQMRDQYVRDYQGQRQNTFNKRLGLTNPGIAAAANEANMWANAANNAFSTGGQLLSNGMGTLAAAKAGATPAAVNKSYIEPVKPAGGVAGIGSAQPVDAGQLLANANIPLRTK